MLVLLNSSVIRRCDKKNVNRFYLISSKNSFLLKFAFIKLGNALFTDRKKTEVSVVKNLCNTKISWMHSIQKFNS